MTHNNNNNYVELRIIQAKDLKSLSVFTKNQPYAVAWVNPERKVITKTVKDGGKDPFWDEQLRVPVEEADILRGDVAITIEIRNHGCDRIIGTSHIPLSSITPNASNTQLTYQIIRPSGKAKGSLNVIAKIVQSQEEPSSNSGEKEKANHVEEKPTTGKDKDPSPPVVTAYPPPQQGSYSGAPPPNPYNQQYPPPTQAYYPPQYPGYPPPQGYPPSQGYPPQPYYPQQYPPPPGYYGGPPQKPHKKPSKFGGSGFGLGLLGGALGGILIGDAISDAAYDGGDFGDGGGDFGGDF